MEKVSFVLKNGELLKILNTLNKLNTSTGGSAEFKLAKAINKNVLKPIFDALELLQKPSEGIIEYSNKYYKLLQEVDSSNFSPKEKQEIAQKELEILDADYKEVLDERRAQLADVNSVLADTMDVDLYPFSNEDILSAFKSIDPSLYTSEDFENLLLLVK